MVECGGRRAALRRRGERRRAAGTRRWWRGPPPGDGVAAHDGEDAAPGREQDVKGKLDAANAELKKVRDQNAELEKRLSQSETSLAQSSAANTRGNEQAAQQRARMDELVKQFRETIENLKKTELERNELKTTLAARESVLGTCVANNDKLFATGNEILDRYEAKGCFASAREKEPFTQVKRVQLQNLVDAYRWQLEDQKLPESVTKQSTPTAGDRRDTDQARQ
jgi:chromosome segregation ATPase